jgi:Protein of unknown function (DUF2934)
MSESTGTKTAPTTKTPEAIARVEPTIEQIRQRAYELYLARGDRPGDELKDWLQAERELRAKQSYLLNAGTV